MDRRHRRPKHFDYDERSGDQQAWHREGSDWGSRHHRHSRSHHQQEIKRGSPADEFGRNRKTPTNSLTNRSGHLSPALTRSKSVPSYQEQMSAQRPSVSAAHRRDKRRPSSYERPGHSDLKEHHHSSHNTNDDMPTQMRQRQLVLYQQALKDQIVQSDHLIKAVYRFSDCIDMTEKAMRALHDVMGDYWEDDWPGAEQYYTTLQDQEQLWETYEQSMRKLIDPIRQYEGQFEGAEDKIEEYESVRGQYRQACASVEALRRRRPSGSEIAFAESDRDRLGQRYEQLVAFLGSGLPKIIASRIPFMEKLFFGLSNSLLQFCLETSKVQSRSCSVISKLRTYDLSIALGEGRSRTTIRAPARKAASRSSSSALPAPSAARPASRRKSTT